MSADECPCSGTGWRPVMPKYAESQADAKVDREKDPRRWESTYAAELNSVYPCKVHNADTFWRWANGHLDRHHDRSNCPDCQPVKASGRSMRSQPQRVGGWQPPAPTDDDYARSGAE